MKDPFESASFTLPSQVRDDVAGRLKEEKGIKSIELQIDGEGLSGGREFGELLSLLKKRGVKVSHEVIIKLGFNQSITREKALALVESMPKPTNGQLKVKIHFDDLEGTN